MRMAAVGHNVDVSEVDQEALAWFLDCAFAKSLKDKSLGGQSGSHRQVRKLTPQWLWTEYKANVGEGPVAPSALDPLLVSLPELSAGDGDFDALVVEMLTRSTWDVRRFVRDNGVGTIRETIREQTDLQYGDHITTSATNSVTRRFERILQIQQTWAKKTGTPHTPWAPSKPQNYSSLSKEQKNIARRKAINEKYFSMKREVQSSIVTTLPVKDRAQLAVALALGWFKDSNYLR
jgi:hypothetical protein